MIILSTLLSSSSYCAMTRQAYCSVFVNATDISVALQVLMQQQADASKKSTLGYGRLYISS
jgi:hypothetical protein